MNRLVPPSRVTHAIHGAGAAHESVDYCTANQPIVSRLRHILARLNCRKTLPMVLLTLITQCTPIYYPAVNWRGELGLMKTHSRIAVLEFGASNRMYGIAAAEAATTILPMYGFTVVERMQLDRVFKEYGLMQSGALSDNDRRQIGELLNLDAVMVGTVTRWEDFGPYVGNNVSLFRIAFGLTFHSDQPWVCQS